MAQCRHEQATLFSDTLMVSNTLVLISLILISDASLVSISDTQGDGSSTSASVFGFHGQPLLPLKLVSSVDAIAMVLCKTVCSCVNDVLKQAQASALRRLNQIRQPANKANQPPSLPAQPAVKPRACNSSQGFKKKAKGRHLAMERRLKGGIQ